MNKLSFILVIGLLLSFETKIRAQQYHLLTTSQDLKQPALVDSVVSIRVSEEAKHSWVKYKNGQKIKVLNATVWGYIDKKGRVYRFDKGYIYRVVSQGNPIVYEREEQRSVGKPVYTGNFLVRYQSVGLDGKIYPTS